MAANGSARFLPPVSIALPNSEDKSLQVTVAAAANADPYKQVTAKVIVNPEIGTIVTNPTRAALTTTEFAGDRRISKPWALPQRY